MKIMAFSPITSWQTDGEKIETVTLFSWAPKSLQLVTASMKLKKCLSLGRKAVTNLDSKLKSRDVTLPTKVHIVKAVGFPVVMYRCDSWARKKAEHQRIVAFELWCWRKLLRVPWTAWKSTLNIHWNDWWLSWSSNTLATWWKNQLIGKDPGACKVWGQEEQRERGWDVWMASWTQWTWVWTNSGR